MKHQKRSKLNLGNLLVVVGLGWLAFGFWLPYATADRVFRIESRASQVAERFSELVCRDETIDWSDLSLRDSLLQTVNKISGHPDPASSLHLQVTDVPARFRDKVFLYQGKHYYYMLTNTPHSLLDREQPIKRPQDTTPRQRVVKPQEDRTPFEVYAWPRKGDVSCRTVFYFASDAKPAFHRNLDWRYLGSKSMPHPGDGHLDVMPEVKQNDYRGEDGERWIYLRDPDRPNARSPSPKKG